MTKPIDHVTLTLDRRLLEHPAGLHRRKMQSAVWLYLVLLARLHGRQQLEVDPVELAQSLGLPEGTIRSWLGHLRKGGYLELARTNGGRTVRVPKASPVPAPASDEPTRFFTAAKLARALGAEADDPGLAGALRDHDDATLRKALAQALAVPAAKIRRSRTALFLYLLNHHDQQEH